MPPTALPVHVGKPLERARVAESLRILFRTGDYADVRAVETPVGRRRPDRLRRQGATLLQSSVDSGAERSAFRRFGGGRDAILARAALSQRSGRRRHRPPSRHVARRRFVLRGNLRGDASSSRHAPDGHHRPRQIRARARASKKSSSRTAPSIPMPSCCPDSR